jgi:GT2 family glycosyltransferase
MDVSVCIANWNCRDMLRACLHSLLRQPQGARLEVIVVDNASSDGAAKMVAAEFPDAALVQNGENLGFAKASNQAAALARGRHLLFLNNDTLVPEHAIGKLFAFAEQNPHLGMIGPRLRDSAGEFQISYRSRPTVGALLHRTVLFRWTRLFGRSYRDYRRSRFNPFHRGPVDLLMGAAVLMPRTIFEECGRWDEDFPFGGEDLELAARVGRKHQVYYLPDVEITHYGRVSSRQNIGFSTESVAAGYIQYLRKMGTPHWQIIGYKLVVSFDSPLQLLGKILEYLSRRLAGRREKASKSLLAARGLWHFVRYSYPKFWKA